MIRSMKYRLYPNKHKAEELEKLLILFQTAVNYYIKIFIDDFPKSRKNCYNFYNSNTLPTARLEDNAAQVAHDIIKSQRESGKKSKESIIPNYTGGMRLNAKNIRIEKYTHTIYNWIYFQPLRIYLPYKLYQNKCMNIIPRNELTIMKRNGEWYVKLNYEMKPEECHSDKITAVDVGINSIITTPNGKYGDLKFKQRITKKINKIKRLRIITQSLGVDSIRLSKMEQKLSAYIKNVKHNAINKMLETEMPGKVIVEELDIRNTRRKRSKILNHKVSRSGICGIKKIIEQKCEERGIEYERINPAYTSRTCPKCNHEDKKNRKNIKFKCLACGYEGDADFIGSVNILRRSKDYSDLKSSSVKRLLEFRWKLPWDAKMFLPWTSNPVPI